MPVLTRIRKHAGLVVIVICISLGAFIMMDALDSDTSLLQGKRNLVGEINGQEIPIQEFEKKFEEIQEAYKLNTNQTNLDEQTTSYLREQTWNQYVQDIIMNEEYEQLGIQVTSDELFNMVQGNNPHPMVKQAFTNPQTGIFDPAQVLLFLKNMDNDQTGDQRKRWLGFEDQIKKDRVVRKYLTLISKGMFVPKFQVENEYNNRYQTANIKYLLLPYSAIADSLVKFSDADLENYLKKHEGKFKQEESRSIEYVTFDINPTEKDTLMAEKYVKDQFEAFKSAENDSIFIKLNSDNYFDGSYLNKTQLESVMADTFFTADTGTFIGPYLDKNSFVIGKLIDRKMIADSVKASHILIKVAANENPELAQKIIDSLKNEAEKKDADFAKLAIENSQDDGSKINGGDLGWIKPGEMVAQFNNAIFYQGNEGDLLTVRTQFGWHLIKIFESKKTSMAVKVAFLTKKIVASGETERAMYAIANEFAGKNRTSDEFEKASSSNNLSKRKAEAVKKNDYNVIGIGTARDIIRWAFQSEKGTVSNVFAHDNKYVVALLNGVKNEGLPSVDDVRQELELEVKKEKKAEMLSEKMKGATMEGIAKQNNTEVRTANNISFASPFIAGVGAEPKVVGTIFGIKEKTISKPIGGNMGVFVVEVESVTAPDNKMDLSQYKKSMLTNLQSRADNNLIEALKKNADIQDNRFLFY